MKPLLMLCLFVGVAIGQSKLPMSELSHNSAQGVGFRTFKFVDSLERVVKVRDLFDYEAECRKDSAIITYKIERVDIDEHYYTWRKIPVWKHTKPSLQGFIEWLRKVRKD